LGSESSHTSVQKEYAALHKLCTGMSLHVIIFTRSSPTLILQATDTGMKRPGYEAIQASIANDKHVTRC